MKYYKNPDFEARNPKQEPTSIGEVIKELLEFYKISGKLQETHILNVWDDIMGEDVAQKTEKLFIKDRKIYVKLTSPALVQELYLSKSKIRKQLNKAADSNLIEDIVFL